jgi:hypothetical protein
VKTVAAFLFYNGRMPTLLQQRRLTSLIVSMAILLNLFAPALSHAVTVRSADPLALEICSAAPAAIGNGTRVPAKPPAHGIKHCVLCAVHAGADAPPPAAAGLLSVLGGHDLYPALRAAAQPQPVLWPDGQPRGPPAAA